MALFDNPPQVDPATGRLPSYKQVLQQDPATGTYKIKYDVFIGFHYKYFYYWNFFNTYTFQYRILAN